MSGFDLINNNLQILTGAFLIILIANLLMFGIGMVGARIFARILSAPEPLLMGMILVFALVGAFVVRGNPGDVIVAVVAGVAGLILRFAKYPIAPIVIDMALGKTFEAKLRQGMINAEGNFAVFIFDPIALTILTITLVIVLLPTLRRRRKTTVSTSEG